MAKTGQFPQRRRRIADQQRWHAEVKFMARHGRNCTATLCLQRKIVSVKSITFQRNEQLTPSELAAVCNNRIEINIVAYNAAING